MRPTSWREIGPGVLVRRHTELDLNCGLVLGGRRALLVDTGWSTACGEELLASIREITAAELVVVNTHAHFDHSFGNAAFRDSQIYAHVGAADAMLSAGEGQRQSAVELLTQIELEDLVPEVLATDLVLPFYLIETDTVIDLGGRAVHLMYGGRAHTDHDLIVAVPDAGVVFWGDLIEQGAPVSTEDAYLRQWVPTLEALIRREAVRLAQIHVPGHGDVVPSSYLSWQMEQLNLMTQAVDGDDAT